MNVHITLKREQAIHKLGKFEVERKVSANTTHLITLDARRTVNILRGIARGVWILDYSWITQSVKANKWLPELSYEMKTFSNAVEVIDDIYFICAHYQIFNLILLQLKSFLSTL